MRPLLFLLLCVGVTLACDPLQISFDLCDADAFCRVSMYIDENGADMSTFEFLYTRLLVNTTNFEQMLCNQTSNNTAAPSDFEILWTLTMSKYRYCNHINQYFDGLVSKCVCKADKLCKYKSANDEEFHFNDNTLFFVALLLILLVMLMFMVKRSSTLYAILVDIRGLLRTHSSEYGLVFTE